MRYLLVFMLLVGLFVVGKNSFHFGIGIRGKGPVKTESRNVSDFHAIELNVAAEVEVKISDNYFVEVEAQENLLPVLKTEVENGTLKIYFDENVSYSKDLRIRVSAPAFDAFAVAGSGTLRALAPVRSEKMNLSVAGSGEIFVPEGDFGTLKTSISGSGGIELGGKADSMTSEISGSGDVKAKAFTANDLQASIAGSGSVTCDVARTLKADIAGSGDVFYSGSPAVNADVSGSGKVTKL